MVQPPVAEELDPALRPGIRLVQAPYQRVPLVTVGLRRKVVQPGQELGGLALGTFGEAAASFDELHQQEPLRAVEDLGDGELAPLAKVAQHVRLTLQVRLALPIHLRDQLRTVTHLDLVYLADAAASKRAGAKEPFA